MSEQFPNLFEMDIEAFEEYISSNKHKKKPAETLQLKKVSPRNLELDDLEKRLEAAKKNAEEAQRQDCTVLVLRLHIKASERDVYNFFSSAGVGKVRDIQLIKDPKTGNNKGAAYVEFYTPDAVLKSMTLSGQMINGQTITVQPSQAEINRAANAVKMGMVGEKELRLPKEGNNKIYVAGLRQKHGKIGPAELRRLFSSFGEIEQVEISQGVGYVQFNRSKDAKFAVSKMDGAPYQGGRLKVGMADTKASIREAQRIGDHDEDGSYIRSSGQKRHIVNSFSKRHR